MFTLSNLKAKSAGQRAQLATPLADKSKTFDCLKFTPNGQC